MTLLWVGSHVLAPGRQRVLPIPTKVNRLMGPGYGYRGVSASIGAGRGAAVEVSGDQVS